MKPLWTLALGLAVLAGSATAAAAQASDWEFEGTVYLFTPETTTGIGNLEGTLKFSDALANLDVAFMGAFQASNGRWSLIADYMLTDVSFGNDTPGPAFSGLNTALKTQMLSGYAAYRVYEDQRLGIDLAGGFRWFNTSTDLTLLPGTSPGRTSSVDESWVDPIIGARMRVQFSEKWSGVLFADYGGFSSGSDTWQVLLTAGYQINENWTARFGYRQISVENDINGTPFSFDQSGPVFGFAYRF